MPRAKKYRSPFKSFQSDGSRSLTAGPLDGLQFRARRGITMSGSNFRLS